MDITGNTWRFYPSDVGAGFLTTPAGGNPTGMAINWDVHPIQISWSGFAGVGETCDLQDGSGKSVFPVGPLGGPFTATANTPNPLYLGPGELGTIRGGLKLPTLSSGVVSITLK
jgi:hypothetical protein